MSTLDAVRHGPVRLDFDTQKKQRFQADALAVYISLFPRHIFESFEIQFAFIVWFIASHFFLINHE